MSEEPDRIDMPLDEPAPPEFVELQGGWFLVPPEALPEEWRERATPVYMIRLDGDELQGFALPVLANSSPGDYDPAANQAGDFHRERSR